MRVAGDCGLDGTGGIRRGERLSGNLVKEIKTQTQKAARMTGY